MTPIAIALFILGIAVGSFISYITVVKAMRQSLDRVFDQELLTYKFVREWAEIADKRYKEYSDYTSKVIDLLKQEVDVLIKDDQLLTETFKEMATAVDSSIKTRFDAFTANRLDVYDVLREDLDGMQATSDSRWDIIRDFIDQHSPRIEIEEDTGYSEVYDPALDTVVRQPCRRINFTDGINHMSYEDYIKLFKEAESYEHENREEEAGAPEGGDAGHQEAEQDAVLQGETDGKLVQSELAEDRLGNPPEAEEGQGFADVTYDYDQH